MKQYQTFICQSVGFDEQARTIELRYSLDDELSFVETLTLPDDISFAIQDRPALERALFALHLIGGMSYYKTCLPPQIDVRSGSLTADQAAFWDTVYTQGLGEFFYQNNIDFRGLINFPAATKEEPDVQPADGRRMHALTPVGGGKDSIVSIELIKQACIPQTLLRVGGHPLIDAVAKTADVPALTIKRALSPALFELNEQGALNGHVPITAYLSVLSVVLAELYGYSHVIFSNERSASEGNITMHGMEINHQWSKSLEFETAFRSYLTRFVTNNVEYISLLRPLSELHILQLFTRYPQYFPLFTSCNANWRIVKERPTERWCGHCPKCAFSFALLAAFLPAERVLEIFSGKNLFNDEALLPLYRELLGIEGIKPFECVGTPEETWAALMLASDREGWESTPVMEMFAREGTGLFPHADTIVESLLKPSEDHHLSEPFSSLLPR